MIASTRRSPSTAATTVPSREISTSGCLRESPALTPFVVSITLIVFLSQLPCRKVDLAALLAMEESPHAGGYLHGWLCAWFLAVTLPITAIAIEEPKAPFDWRHYFLRF